MIPKNIQNIMIKDKQNFIQKYGKDFFDKVSKMYNEETILTKHENKKKKKQSK